MPLWLIIVLIVIGIYLAISIALFYMQDYLMFKPEKLSKDFQFYYDNQEFKEYNLETADGANLNGILFKSKTKTLQGVVLYLKGNSRSIKGWGKFAVDFTRHGYNVLMVDYRGFGKSTGKRSQKAIKRDLQLIYNKVRETIDEEKIILYGRSLGSGFATKLASMNSPKMLILDAPYYSLSKVAGRYMPFMPISFLNKFPMPTHKWLKYVKCPIHIIHGTKDKLIPYKTSVKLAQINPSRTQLYTVLGGGHKNLNTFESYHQMIDKILNTTTKEIDYSTTSLNVKRGGKKKL